ncbi:cysteine proteinase [Trametopsis cervina]|nr:cysteine proteinase [Trametopsis cervina]
MSGYTNTAKPSYRKHFLPLESNPEVFNQLIYDLGVADTLAFCDVLSLDESDLLALVPRPVHALLLVFPTSEDYETLRAGENGAQTAYDGHGDSEDALWFKQTINNACGLYGILHAVANGKAKDHIVEGTLLARLLQQCIPCRPEDRALVLEDSAELEKVYTAAALQGDTAPPDNAEDEVDFHYICFARSNKSGKLYELDGDKWGPRMRIC